MTSAKSAYYVHNGKFEISQCELQQLQPDEVRVAISFCGICGTDLHIFHGAMPHRLGDKRVLGHEASGRIAAIGANVEDLNVGQKVVVRPLDSCGKCPACENGQSHICHNLKFLGIDTDGGFSEFWTVPAHTIHILPETVDLKAAALVEPLAVACHDVERGRVTEGEDVLVIGGGPIGILVAIAARSAGAKVVVSEVNELRLKVAQTLGFETINPAKDDLKEQVMKRTSGKGMDAVFEVSGAKPGLDATTQTAAVRGRIVIVAIYPEAPAVDLFQVFWRELELIGTRVYEPQDYEKAIEMLANGDVNSDVLITHLVDFDEIQSAFENLGNSPTAMKMLIEVAGEQA